MLEKTLLVIKPDGTRRRLEKKIIKRIKEANFKIIAKKKLHLTKKLAEEFYSVHKNKNFFKPLIKFMTSGKIEAVILESNGAVKKLRKLVGETLPSKAEAGTIRADFKGRKDIGRFGAIENLVHASDSVNSAKREIKVIFGKNLKN